MRKWKLRLAIVIALAGLAGLGWGLFVGPRMYVQPNLRAYDAAMPGSPQGSVPITDAWPALPSAEQAATVANPLFVDRSPTAADYARGKTYYTYYCAFCHGQNGDGRAAPVAESFVPFPPDLRSAKLKSYSDGQLLRAMLTGPGHQPADNDATASAPSAAVAPQPGQTPLPVLQYTVLPQHRWYLVLYLKSLVNSLE